MDWSKLPPIAALRAFSAFAEKGSVVQAGQALNVSHAAISQQIKNLEAHLGISLVNRQGRNLLLTAAGRTLAKTVTQGFSGIADVIEALAEHHDDRPVHISTTPMLAASWLMPRLSSFRLRHPTIDLLIDPTPEVATLEPGGVEIALRYGKGNWPGVQAEPLIQSPLVIVAAPSLMGDRDFTTAGALAELPWLNEHGVTETSRWIDDLRAGSPGGSVTTLPGNLMLDGVRDGQGVAVVVEAFVKSDIAAGRLCTLFTDDDSGGYFIVSRQDLVRPSARAFLAWLRRERDDA